MDPPAPAPPFPPLVADVPETPVDFILPLLLNEEADIYMIPPPLPPTSPAVEAEELPPPPPPPEPKYIFERSATPYNPPPPAPAPP